MSITVKLEYKDLPATGVIGAADNDLDLLITATGTTKVDKLTLGVDFNDLTFTKVANDWSVTHKDIDDVTLLLKDIERLENGTKGLALDVTGDAGEVYALLATALGKADVTPELMGIALSLKDAGKTDLEVAQTILDSTVYKQDALGSSNETLVKQIYKNILGTTPSFADLVYFTTELDKGTFTQAQLLELASNLELTRDASHINLVGMSSIEYTPIAG